MAETSTFDLETVPVCFNMDLANAPTSARFCYEAAAVLDKPIHPKDEAELELSESSENISEIVDGWTSEHAVIIQSYIGEPDVVVTEEGTVAPAPRAHSYRGEGDFTNFG